MRLEALDLIAYGPFTRQHFAFPGAFTIVYGLNEAGKTSALRAIADGLYGIGDGTLNGRELAVEAYLREHVVPCLMGSWNTSCKVCRARISKPCSASATRGWWRADAKSPPGKAK